MLEKIWKSIRKHLVFKIIYVSAFLGYGHFSGEIPVVTRNSWIVWLFVFLIFFGPALSTAVSFLIKYFER